MKTSKQRKTLIGQGQSKVKRDIKRGRILRKTLDELERQAGERVYFIEGACFDYCC